jgi:polyphosphate glucokinase
MLVRWLPSNSLTCLTARANTRTTSGSRGYEKFGKKKWREYVATVASEFQKALVADYVVLGGGQAKLLKEMPKGCRRGDNFNAFKGGQRVWEQA